MPETTYEKRYSTGQSVEIAVGDLTRQEVDAIVNAANSHLAHGGGVAAAIVQRGGDVIQRESNAWVDTHGPVTHENPAYTTAGKLPCRFVIHAVGPVWGEGDEEHKLACAVKGSLRTANELDLHSVAFPAISTGIFGFPLLLAADIFAHTIEEYFSKHPDSTLRVVRIVLMDAEVYQVFVQAFKKL